MTRAFFDSNILVYAFSIDPRATAADVLLEPGGHISVQSLNEFANVARRKLDFAWEEIDSAIHKIMRLCEEPIVLDVPLHHLGRELAARHRLSIYDAMIVAAALSANCDTLYSEDMHDGLLVDGRLRIVNPFAAA